jgi:GntR family transcriptional regulator/MocR family aminotransferase
LAFLGELASAVKVNTALAIVVQLSGSVSDVDVALRALPFRLASAPLSTWYMQSPRSKALLLGVTSIIDRRLATDCRRLVKLAS